MKNPRKRKIRAAASDRPAEGSQRDVERLASASEATGLIPAALEDEAQAEAYEDLWPLVGQKPVD